MLRRAPRILLCLLTGALLTIATAWSFAIFAPRPAQAVTNDKPTAWPTPVPADWTPPESDETRRGFGISLHTTTARSEVPFRPWPRYIRKRYVAKVVTTGWPYRALYSEDKFVEPPPPINPADPFAILDGDMAAWERMMQDLSRAAREPPEEPLTDVPLTAQPWPVPQWLERRLHDQSSLSAATNALRIPNRLLCRGFILNTLFYAAAVYALFSLTLFIRATHRRRRHCCAHCNYNLTGLPPNSPCPECGKAQPRNPS